MMRQKSSCVSLPFPAGLTLDQSKAAASAVADVTADLRGLVDRSGTVSHWRGEHYGVFRDPLAYRLSCERCISRDGSVWETVPVLLPGVVGYWTEEDAGRILHLVRDISICGELVFGSGWEPIWISAPWRGLSELQEQGAELAAGTKSAA